MSTATETPAKNKLGSFMRLLYEVRITERQYFSTHEPKLMRKVFALLTSVDKKVEEYFEEFPEELPQNYGALSTSLGYFMRRMPELRKWENEFLKTRTPESLAKLKPLIENCDRDIEDYFRQHPEEKPVRMIKAEQEAEAKRDEEQFEFMKQNGLQVAGFTVNDDGSWSYNRSYFDHPYFKNKSQAA